MNSRLSSTFVTLVEVQLLISALVISNGALASSSTPLQIFMINTDSGHPILDSKTSTGVMQDGSVVTLGTSAESKELTIRACVAGTNCTAQPSGVGSIVFRYDSGKPHIETYAPFDLGGDSGSKGLTALPMNFTVGHHFLVVTAYSGSGGTGNILSTTALHFTVAQGKGGAVTLALSTKAPPATTPASSGVSRIAQKVMSVIDSPSALAGSSTSTTGTSGVGSSSCTGNVYRWVAARNGNYRTPTNWSPAGIPGPADFAIINVGSAITVTMPSTVVNLCGIQIQNNVNFALGGNAFNLTSAYSIALSGVQVGFTGTGTLSISGGSANSSGTSMSISGTPVSAGTSSITTTISGDMGSQGYFPVTLNLQGGVTNLNSTQHLGGLFLSGGALASLQTRNTGGKKFIRTADFQINDTASAIDIQDNDMIFDYDSSNPSLTPTLASIRALLVSACDNLAFDKPGIKSSAVGPSAHWLTTIGYISNNANINSSGTPTALYSTFDGESLDPSGNDILVKYTYFGDANLDGKVDGSDYSLIDYSSLSQSSGPPGGGSWGSANGPTNGFHDGDFNYDGAVDGSDYTLIDNAFNTQGAQIN
jgi:hypothetical protein